MSWKTKLAGAVIKTIANEATRRVGDAVTKTANDPEALAKIKGVLHDGSLKVAGESLAKRADQAMDVGITLAKQKAEADRLVLEAKKKRLRWVGAGEAIIGSIILAVIIAIILFFREHEFWRAVLQGSGGAQILAIGLIVSVGLIITGIRTLFTVRG